MKAFYAYDIRSNAIGQLIRALDQYMGGAPSQQAESPINDYLHDDPTGSAWYSSGLVPAMPGDKLFAIFSTQPPYKGIAMTFQWSERILPTATVKEKVLERVQKLIEVEGRNPARKETAQIRDDVVAALLPTAFIRRTLIPVLFVEPGRLLIGTGSAKRADDIASDIRGMVASLGMDALSMTVVGTQREPEAALTELVSDCGYSDILEVGDKVALVGPDDTKVAIKDDSIGEPVRLVDEENFRVQECAVVLQRDGEELVRARITSKLQFKGVKVAARARDDRESADPAAERIASYMLIASAIDDLVSTVVEMCGGSNYNDEDAL